MASNWFSIRTFYRSYCDGRPEKPDLIYDPDATLLEERMLLIKAKNKAEALKKAEKEAKEYARRATYTNPYNQKVTTKCLDFFDVFEVSSTLADRTEIFASSRIMSKKVTDRKIAHVYVGKKEKSLNKSKRRKFINQDYLASLDQK